MTRLILFAFIGLAAAQTGTRTVYILPMAGGLDQYLAEQITREHAMQVVADPAMAELVMTDHVNEAFAQQMAKLYPLKSEARKDENGPEGMTHSFRSSTGKGTVFLVEAKSRQVIWSDYEKPRSRSASQMNREAGRIVKKLQSGTGKGAGRQGS